MRFRRIQFVPLPATGVQRIDMELGGLLHTTSPLERMDEHL